MAQRLTDKTVKALPTPSAATGSHTTPRSRALVLASRRRVQSPSSSTIGARLMALSVATPSARLPELVNERSAEEAKRLKREVDGGGDPVGEHVSEPGRTNRC